VNATNAADAINAIVTLLGAATGMLAQAQGVSLIIQEMQAQGRTSWTPTEELQVLAAVDAARRLAVAAVSDAPPTMLAGATGASSTAKA